MTSESMHGRGYVNGGDSIAANYLKNEFRTIGLKPAGEDYYQKFSFAVNTFPGNISVSLDGKELVSGKDYIVSPSSPDASGTYSAVTADEKLVKNKRRQKKFMTQDFSNKVVMVNDTGKETPMLHDLLGNGFKARAIAVFKDKLTWSVSQNAKDFPLIELLRTSVTQPKKICYTIESKVVYNHPSQNVIGCIRGSVFPDSFVVYTAHYDHLGQMGKDVYFPGANDNASGCAMLLNLAKYYSMPEHLPGYSIAFIAFCGEEAGILGSKYFTEHPLFPLKNIRFLLNMDIMGTGEDGITVVNGSVFKNEFEKLKQINAENNYIKDVNIRGKARNSDHFYFSENGVHAFFIYSMGGIKAYHDIYDKAETLPLNQFQNLFLLITKFGEYLQK